MKLFEDYFNEWLNMSSQAQGLLLELKIILNKVYNFPIPCIYRSIKIKYCYF